LRAVLEMSDKNPLPRSSATGWRSVSYHHLSSLAIPHQPTSSNKTPKVEIHTPKGSLFVLATEQGDRLLSVGEVRDVRIDHMAVQIEREKRTSQQAKLLTVRYEKPRPGRKHELDLMYFRPGIRWIPTYRIEIDKTGRAQLVMQAEVINEAEDFVDTSVDFVVGLPTFRFKDVISPLSLEQVMVNALVQAAPQLMGQLAAQGFSNAQFHSRAGERHRPSGTSFDPAGEAAVRAMNGTEVQDLFYYSTRRLSLRKGERAVVEVMRTTVPFRHVYTWDVELGKQDASHSHSGNSPLKVGVNQVWHQIELKNQSGRPWTTGPALIMQDGRPVGQDMMTFTPPGQSVQVPMTMAVSVRGTAKTVEIERKHGAKKLRHRTYTRMTNQTTLRIVNSGKTAVHLRINARAKGTFTSASQQGKIEQQGHAPGADPLIDTSSRVVWELKLKPGQTKEVSSQYHTWARE
jgi:hypothetical protein